MEWTSKRADRVEKLYSEQLETQLNRKTEQERELSERESKILDLRLGIQNWSCLVIQRDLWIERW